MKITFGIIVLNTDFVFKQCLESIYPYAHKICIAEGPVQWWINQGVNYSTDETIEIIKNFPDSENKILPIFGIYKDKHDQCRDWFKLVPNDTDYVWCVDADEIHDSVPTIIEFLKETHPTSVGFKSDTFFGGFDHILGGFEADHSFKRILKYIPGCTYRTHRPPTLSVTGGDIAGNDISGKELYNMTGITMKHYSYVSPKQVYDKIRFYEDKIIAKGKCIPNYFKDVFLKWIIGNDQEKQAIEDKWMGVHEFHPSARGECRTQKFTGQHPGIIQRDMPELKHKFEQQLKQFINGNNV